MAEQTERRKTSCIAAGPLQRDFVLVRGAFPLQEGDPVTCLAEKKQCPRAPTCLKNMVVKDIHIDGKIVIESPPPNNL